MSRLNYMFVVLVVLTLVCLFAYNGIDTPVRLYRELCPHLANQSRQQGQSGKGPEVIKLDWRQAAGLIYWFVVSPEEYSCKEMVKVGNWHMCQDIPYTVSSPCLVYSFGIANDFSFDDAMGLLGCEVHSFDPSMKTGDHRRNDNVTFHALGLSGADNDSFVARRDGYVRQKQVWQIHTLKTIMKKLGHQKKSIDVLKMDVEGHEWAVIWNLLHDDLLPQIRQFYFEFHLFPDWPARSSYAHLYNVFTRLKGHGYKAFRKSPHPHKFTDEKFNIQGDINFVNTNFTEIRHKK